MAALVAAVWKVGLVRTPWENSCWALVKLAPVLLYLEWTWVNVTRDTDEGSDRFIKADYMTAHMREKFSTQLRDSEIEASLSQV